MKAAKFAKKIRLQPGDVLAIRDDAPLSQKEEWDELAARLFIVVLHVQKLEDIQRVDEAFMHEHGWMRIPKHFNVKRGTPVEKVESDVN